jgi:riboflavin kinase|tara:strand:- start:368 stop:1000 length:633 start_codon:yes stop_codon:yes gene_type:complete
MQMTLLEYIAERAGLYGSLETSTSEIAKYLETSQQTISRKLIEFEGQGIIARQITGKGVTLSVDAAGRKLLEDKFQLLSSVFKSGSVVNGTLVTGLGEGAYYVDQAGYQKQFLSKLGFKAFPGTLNLTISESEFGKIAGKEKIVIAGFKNKERSFGGLTCYRAVLNKQEVAIAVPDRTAHSGDTLEVISAVNLRQKFSLNDGDRIEVKPL